jgi:translation initiation factor IF-1
MANKDLIELKGTIEELLPATTFKVKLESGQIVIGHLSGKLRMNKIRLSLGDSVRVEMTPYDLTKGRITYRF